MFYAIFIPPNCVNRLTDERPAPEDLVFDDIKAANVALKKLDGSRMKTFTKKEDAISFLSNPDRDSSLADALDRLSIQSDVKQPETENAGPHFPSIQPSQSTQLRRKIEAGDYDEVEQMIWENPRHLVTVCDSAVYLMAGPKWNACHIAARSNKPDMIALILDTVSNINFLRKLYPEESDSNVQDRLKHLVDSYLNTPDPRQGNTPLHFACKLGHHRVVRVLLTYEGCDVSLLDSNGKTAEESICLQKGTGDTNLTQKIRDLFKSPLDLPVYRDQLKKRLALERRRSKAGYDSDTSFSDDSFMLISPIKKTA